MPDELVLSGVALKGLLAVRDKLAWHYIGLRGKVSYWSNDGVHHNTLLALVRNKLVRSTADDAKHPVGTFQLVLTPAGELEISGLCAVGARPAERGVARVIPSVGSVWVGRYNRKRRVVSVTEPDTTNECIISWVKADTSRGKRYGQCHMHAWSLWAIARVDETENEIAP